MRRAASSVTVALGLLGVTVAFSGAVQAAAPASSAPAPGKKRCTITDERLRELSGLVATKSGYVVINDGSDKDSRKRVFFLDTKCEIAKDPVRYTGQGPLDTEDLALSPNGRTLFIGDIGDNDRKRPRIAVWSMPVDGSAQPKLHRMSYPDGKPRDAEALLIGADNLPLVITKVPSGAAEIFTPSAKLKTGDTEPVPMKKVGQVTLPKTNTDNRLGVFGRVSITGAARSPDGSKVVLRTYADAFEYDVAGGDIVGALTTGKPRVTPLADPFGEAISYTPDGKLFVTVSDGGELAPDDAIDVLAYTPSTKGAEALDPGAGPAVKPKAERSWFSTLTLDDITYLIAAVGVLGALLVGAGIFGILRARKQRAAGRGGAGDADQPERDETAYEPGGDRPRGGVYGGAAPAGGVYGAGAPPAGRPGGAVNGTPGRAGPPAGGGVYGGGRPAGGGGYGGGPRPAEGGGGRGGNRGGGVYGGQPGGGRGGVYGGGRAEPPRRDEDRPYGERRPGGGEPGPGRGGQYGGYSGREQHRGDRY
ncbi:hypothetical protein AB0H57_01235 [Micromonospora sp. NPDC050686]|uniref:hypothetical protein n=1 Tax=Micromonospora sp. NPDC050686 TaxID=3154631 RepID=UPI0033FADCCF